MADSKSNLSPSYKLIYYKLILFLSFNSLLLSLSRVTDCGDSINIDIFWGCYLLQWCTWHSPWQQCWQSPALTALMTRAMVLMTRATALTMLPVVQQRWQCFLWCESINRVNSIPCGYSIGSIPCGNGINSAPIATASTVPLWQWHWQWSMWRLCWQCSPWCDSINVANVVQQCQWFPQCNCI